MGVLTDYFLATPNDLPAVEAQVPAAWPRVEGKSFGTVPLENLGKMVGAEAFIPGEPVHHGDDFAWFVQEVTAKMVDALAGLSDRDVEEHGAAMAKTPEVDWSAKDGRAMVKSLRELAKAAKSTKKRMYLFTCV